MFNVGACIRLTKFIKFLSESDWSFTVLCAGMRGGWPRESQALMQDVPKATKIIRAGLSVRLTTESAARRGRAIWRNLRKEVLVYIRNNLVFPDGAFHWIFPAVIAGASEMGRHKQDLIYATMPPISDLFVGAMLKLITKAPMVIEFRDDWLGTVEASCGCSGMLGASHLALERAILHLADRVITVTHSSKSALLRRHPSLRSKVCVIPNGCDLQEIPPQDELPDIDRGQFIVTHAGSLETDRPISGLVGAVEILAAENERFRRHAIIRLVGRIKPSDKRLIAASKAKELFEIRPYSTSRVEYWKMLASSAVLVLISDRDKPTQTPGKTYEYWAAKRPVLNLSLPGESTEFIQRNRLGISVLPTDAQAIARALSNYWESWEGDTPILTCTRGLAAYNRKALANALAAEFEELITRQRPY